LNFLNKYNPARYLPPVRFGSKATLFVPVFALRKESAISQKQTVWKITQKLIPLDLSPQWWEEYMKGSSFRAYKFFLGIFLLNGFILFSEFSAKAEPDDVLPLFQGNEVLKITIEAPLTTLIKTAPKSMDPYEGTLMLDDSGIFDIKVNVRGLSRRDKETCKFPPLRVNFKKKQVKETLFHGQNKLKLVTHCQKSSRFQQFYILEYAIYRAYNALTPLSLRVRMAEITYMDTDGKNKPVTRFGFFIEDIDDLAERNGLKELNIEKLNRSDLDTSQAALYALFQYFTGNLDWSNIRGPAGSNCCHNSKLLILPGGSVANGAVFPVPYDFDFTGMVNAPYALPPEGMKVRTVRKRLYRGACLYNNEIPVAIDLFNVKRDEIEGAVRDERLLTARSKKQALGYIEDFYEVINNPTRVEKQILVPCVGKKN